MHAKRDPKTATPEGSAHEQAIRWEDYLPAARALVEESRSRYGVPGVDFRCEEDAEGSGGADGETEGGGDGKGGVDLSSPQVQAAVAAAERRAREAARAELEPHKQKLLDELKPFKALGKPEELKARLERLEKLETASKAAEVGADPDKLKAAIEAGAQEKAREYIAQYEDRDKARETKVTELETQLQEVRNEAHRRYVKWAILDASIPPETRILHDGAEKYLVDTLAELVVPHEVPGLGEVPRLRKDKEHESLIPTINGKSPDGLMDLRELFSLSRQGKGPVPGIGLFFVSNGAGSGTTTPSGASGGPGNFHKLTQEQRMAVLQDMKKQHGPQKGAEAYKAWMEDSPKPEAAGAKPA